jgi:serine/threonine protein kinase
VGGELGLIQAARMQASHRSRPAMRGVGMATGIPGYTIIREIHRGGQGVVYLGRHDGTGRQVAIKLMREGALARQSERLRFDREIQVLAQLDNPNIVTIHDSGVAGGCGYYVMDYIAGQKLDEYVRNVERPLEETLRLFAKICHAVNAAHLRGVIHRDLKPGNIRVTPAGEPHVLDFGLAKLESVDGAMSAAPTQMTATGQFIGSLPWASPEQVGGDDGQIDVRTDVYALGVILYELLTGRFPYDVQGPMPEVVGRIIGEMPTRPGVFNKQVNSELDTIVLKCLAKPRDSRYETPGELARDIERMLEGEPIAAKRDNWRYMSRKVVQRYWVWIAVICAVTGSLLVAAGGTLLDGVDGTELSELRRRAASAEAERVRLESENARLRSENEALRRLLEGGGGPSP